MSDPAHGGYVCCDTPMIAQALPAIADGTCAWLCAVDHKWRHALAPDDVRRPQVVAAMEQLTQELHEQRTR